MALKAQVALTKGQGPDVSGPRHSSQHLQSLRRFRRIAQALYLVMGALHALGLAADDLLQIARQASLLRAF